MLIRSWRGATFLGAGIAVLALLAALGGRVGVRAASPSGPMLLVVSKAESRLAIVDPASLSILAWVPTGDTPHEVAASPDGRLAFVTNYGTLDRPGHSISIIDLAARKEIQRVELGDLKRPHGVAVSGGKVFFTAEGARVVARLDPATGKVDWSARTGQISTHMLVVTPDGKKVYTANIGSNSVSAVDISAGAVTQIPVGREPEGLDLSPDGRELWVGQNGDGQISIIDTATDQVKGTIAAGRVPIRVKFTPDGSRVLVSDMAAGELALLSAASRQETRRIPVGAAPVGLLISPDGKRAFIAATGANQVVVVDLLQLSVAERLAVGSQPDGMAWVAAVPPPWPEGQRPAKSAVPAVRANLWKQIPGCRIR